MATTNVLVNRSGTSWTVDVTACELDADINLKDFVALFNGSVVSNNFFNKTTQTTLTYVGSALGVSTQVEIRRRTPNAAKSTALLGSRVRSSDWNAEFDRVYRHFEEYDLNGAGSPVSAPIPKDDAFGVVWQGDTTYPPTRNSLYNFLTTLAPLSSPSLTGNPTAPTQLTSDNSTRIATTAHVKSNLASYALIASPSFTGSPTVPTASAAENSTIIASTAWVRTFVNSNSFVTSSSLSSTLSTYAPLASPALTGTPTAPTAAVGTNTTQVATTAHVRNSMRPAFRAGRASTSVQTGGAQKIPFDSEVFDTDNAYNPTEAKFTVPAGMGGYYIIGVHAVMKYQQNVDGHASIQLYKNSVAFATLTQHRLINNNSFIGYTGQIILQLAAGDFVELVSVNPVSGLTNIEVVSNNAGEAYFYGYRLNA